MRERRLDFQPAWPRGLLDNQGDDFSKGTLQPQRVRPRPSPDIDRHSRRRRVREEVVDVIEVNVQARPRLNFDSAPPPGPVGFVLLDPGIHKAPRPGRFAHVRLGPHAGLQQRLDASAALDLNVGKGKSVGHGLPPLHRAFHRRARDTPEELILRSFAIGSPVVPADSPAKGPAWPADGQNRGHFFFCPIWIAFLSGCRFADLPWRTPANRILR